MASECRGVGGGGLEGSVHVKRVIEMESKHRKIITCQAWPLAANEVRRAQR